VVEATPAVLVFEATLEVSAAEVIQVQQATQAVEATLADQALKV
jgi:hypothetical protein